MRAVWWLLKLTARAATRARRAWERWSSPAMPDELGAVLDVEEPAPRANLRDFLEGEPPEVREELEQLARRYAGTFCGRCGATPENPAARCAACLELLANVVATQNGPGLERLGAVANRLRRAG